MTVRIELPHFASAIPDYGACDSLRDVFAQISRDRDDFVVLSPAGVGVFNGGASTVEFGIVERTMLGFGFGAAAGGAKVVVDLPFLSFALTGGDLLFGARNEMFEIPNGAVLITAPFGSGLGLGRQHEAGSLRMLSSMDLDRVVVPPTPETAQAMAANWIDSGERWLMAIPLTVAKAGQGQLDEYTIEYQARESDFLIAAAGADVAVAARTVQEARCGIHTSIVPIIDLLEPPRRADLLYVDAEHWDAEDRAWLAGRASPSRILGSTTVATTQAQLVEVLRRCAL